MSQPNVQIVVEGLIDEAVLRRIFDEKFGLSVISSFVKGSRQKVLEKLNGYNEAARSDPNSLWVVMVDLNADECAPLLLEWYLPQETSSNFLFRIAVRSIEAWLMADREGIARFLKVPQNRIPSDPDTVLRPKEEMVRLARSSRSREIREALVPPDGSVSRIGRAYNDYLIEFASERWNIDRAKEKSKSLEKALKAISLCLERMSV